MAIKDHRATRIRRTSGESLRPLGPHDDDPLSNPGPRPNVIDDADHTNAPPYQTPTIGKPGGTTNADRKLGTV